MARLRDDRRHKRTQGAEFCPAQHLARQNRFRLAKTLKALVLRLLKTAPNLLATPALFFLDKLYSK
jgi:hypothetical protein